MRIILLSIVLAISLATASEAGEPEAWKGKQEFTECSLDFWMEFLGISKTRGASDPIDNDCKKRLISIIRAVSWVESKHGTGSGNAPKRDPMQCGNPADTHWKDELFDPKGSRVVRGKGKTNLDYSELLKEARKFFDELPDATNKKLNGVFDVEKVDRSKGHRDEKFSEQMSYFWGIMFLILKISKPRAYLLDDCSWSHLIQGAKEYNGGGDPGYGEKIKKALKLAGEKVD